MKHIEILICVSMFCLFAPEAITQPKFGDVFREYSWSPDWYSVLSKKGLDISIPGNIDLQDAVRAEIAIEIANEHLGFDKIFCRINGNEPYRILYPGHEQKHPTPALWFHHWYPVVEVSLSDLKEEAENKISLQIDSLCFDGKQHPNGKVTPENPNGEWGLLPPWCPVYGATLRIFYHPDEKPHVSGKLNAPAENSTIGIQVPFSVSLSKNQHKVKQIDFIGKYEDINFEGDGKYYQWHHHLFKGTIKDHIGTVFHPDSSLYWNTEWLPDQKFPLEFAAIITDEDGLKYMTDPVKNIRLEISGLSVELCRPYEVPRSFTGCQYGTWIFEGPRSHKFYIKGDLSKIIDARYVIASWGDQIKCPGYMINNILLKNKPVGENFFYNLSKLNIDPLTALMPGENIFSTIAQSGRVPDVYIPGVQILIRYKTTN